MTEDPRRNNGSGRWLAALPMLAFLLDMKTRPQLGPVEVVAEGGKTDVGARS